MDKASKVFLKVEKDYRWSTYEGELIDEGDDTFYIQADASEVDAIRQGYADRCYADFEGSWKEYEVSIAQAIPEGVRWFDVVAGAEWWVEHDHAERWIDTVEPFCGEL